MHAAVLTLYAGQLAHLGAGLLPAVVLSQELALGFAAVVTLFGVQCCWQSTNDRMAIEERVKDGHLTEEQARRKIQQLTWSGPAIVLTGLAMLCLAFLR